MSLTIGLTYDLRNDYLSRGYPEEVIAEFDSVATIDALESAIRSNGYRTERVGNARALCARLVAGERWDLVFNIAEGLRGRSREAQAPCLLELYEIPYTFSDPLVCAVTLDKAVAKRLAQSMGERTPAFQVVRQEQDIEKINLPYPVFAKPLAEGSGKGVNRLSKVENQEGLKTVCKMLLERFAQPILVEEYLPGREFTVGILGNGAEARAIGAMEIVVHQAENAEVYSYEAKEKCESLVTYADFREEGLGKEVEELALRVYGILECADAARVDVRCDREGRPSFMEINPLPGLHPTHSDLPMIATRAGMSYEQLIGRIIQNALKRWRVQ